jgi:hypothetical protein
VERHEGAKVCAFHAPRNWATESAPSGRGGRPSRPLGAVLSFQRAPDRIDGVFPEEMPDPGGMPTSIQLKSENPAEANVNRLSKLERRAVVAQPLFENQQDPNGLPEIPRMRL